MQGSNLLLLCKIICWFVSWARIILKTLPHTAAYCCNNTVQQHAAITHEHWVYTHMFMIYIHIYRSLLNGAAGYLSTHTRALREALASFQTVAQPLEQFAVDLHSAVCLCTYVSMHVFMRAYTCIHLSYIYVVCEYVYMYMASFQTVAEPLG